ncbi:MAG: hypothetical protein ACE5HO_21245 [bacterium]
MPDVVEGSDLGIDQISRAVSRGHAGRDEGGVAPAWEPEYRFAAASVFPDGCIFAAVISNSPRSSAHSSPATSHRDESRMPRLYSIFAKRPQTKRSSFAA